MAVRRYPVELEGEIALAGGARLPLRPIRPEDAPLLTRFFEALSERSRYQRFMQHLHALPPGMLARFTNVDYERELGLVVLDPEGRDILAVGRYAPSVDDGNAEFALTVADAWQAKGIGRTLLERLCDYARRAGYRALYGRILDGNKEMLELAARLGFVSHSREGAELIVVRRL
ncbi:MAG TPA: GNAT family N-acetyltransferase [Burkholderiales bacterium]|nr:GNAT family N-acetyltransferase [Burkholderiales bacterium]